MKKSVSDVLLGLAWGDALGCPVEYWDRELIKDVFGCYETLPASYPVKLIPKTERISSYLRPIGLHSDDTQQALTLLHCSLEPDGWSVENWSHHLVMGYEANAWRGTGHNFRHAVKMMATGTPPLQCGSPSAGIGGAMRTGPLGALFHDNIEKLKLIVFESTFSTHADIRAVCMAYAVALCCYWLVNDKPVNEIRFDLADAIHEYEIWLNDSKGICSDKLILHSSSKILKLVLENKFGSASDFGNWFSRHAVQESMIGHDFDYLPNHPFALVGVPYAIGISLSDSHEPRKLLAEIIRQGGDTDTIGSIAGGILGARFGKQWVESEKLFDQQNLSLYCSSLFDKRVPELFSQFVERERLLTEHEINYMKNLEAMVLENGLDQV